MMKRTLPFLTLLLLLPTLLFSQEKEDRDSLVRLLAATKARLVDINGESFRKAEGDVKFLHNGTYLYCDTALWCVEGEYIDAVGHVRIIQENTMLTGDSLHYIIPENLAVFRGALVELIDKERNTLRTNNLDYNTKDSVAYFREGAAMKDKDGNIIESVDGTFESKINLFTFINDVEMFSDSLFFVSDTMKYDTNRETAYFSQDTKGWKGGNYLSSGGGWYNRNNETLYFDKKVYIITDEYEAWCDNLFYDRMGESGKMFKDVQLLDTVNNVLALSDALEYYDNPRKALLYDNPAVVMVEMVETGVDSTFLRADTLLYYSKRMCDIDSSLIKEAKERRSLTEIDAFTNAKGNMKSSGAGSDTGNPAMKGGKPGGGAGMMQGGIPGGKPKIPAGVQGAELGASTPQDTSEVSVNASQKGKKDRKKRSSRKKGVELPPMDSISVITSDTLPIKDSTEIVIPSPSIDSLRLDSLRRSAISDSLARVDSLAIADSLAAIPDTTQVAFMEAFHNVKMYKREMQMKCDSLLYCGIDSIARLFKEPALWKDVKNQLTADSMQIVMEGQEMKKGIMLSNAFIVAEQTPGKYYNQIKSPEMTGYFEDSQIVRFDALGGAQALFYLEEDSVITTMNQKDTKIMSARLANGELQKIYYLDNVKSDAYPVYGLEKEKQRLKDFIWIPELRPASRFDITDRSIRTSMRQFTYQERKFPIFEFTSKYFTGYIDNILTEINSRKPLIWKPRTRSTFKGNKISRPVHSKSPAELKNERLKSRVNQINKQ